MRKVSDNITAHLMTAMTDQRAVTIRYVNDKGIVRRRRIEILRIEVSGAGNLLVRAYDHYRGTARTFRLDRITHYTLHRSPKLAAYRVPVVAKPYVCEEDGEFVSFQAWDEEFTLAA